MTASSSIYMGKGQTGPLGCLRVPHAMVVVGLVFIVSITIRGCGGIIVTKCSTICL